MIGRLAFLALLAALIFASFGTVVGEEHQLELQVVDATGRPLSGVELALIDGGVRRAFRTTDAGLAVFRALQAGTYLAQLQVDGVLVLNETVTVPQEGRPRLVAKVAPLSLVVLDADGLPARDLTVRVAAGAGKVVREAVTREAGTVTFSNLPLSELQAVGVYTVSIRAQGVTTELGTLRHDLSKERYEFVGPLATVRIRVVDLAGNPLPNGTVTLLTGLVTYRANIAEGSAELRGVLTSDVAGKYGLSVFRFYGRNRVNFTLLEASLELARSTNLTLVANALDLEVRALADGEDPIARARVSVSSARGELDSGVTDSEGRVRFRALPASQAAEAGDLRLSLSLGGRYLLNVTHRLTLEGTSLGLAVRRAELAVSLVAADGSPLSGALVQSTEPGTGKRINATSDRSGVALLRTLPVPLRVTVVYEGMVVHAEDLDPTRGRAEVRVSGARIPVTIEVRDWLGAKSPGVTLRAYQAGKEVAVQRADGSFSLVVPVKGSVALEVYLDGRLIEKRVLAVTAPSHEVLVVSGFFAGGGLLGPEAMGMAVSAVVSSAMIAAGVSLVLWARRRASASQARAS
ncbi:MAG: hypothetical protein NZ953_03635 [Thaumarchaeota archaeon]|nr:hypothetical protein [Candidatus Calditenuaceae archaeon]MDW8042815.1 hypothetical protein [Nitrososphaerota archaeon]